MTNIYLDASALGEGGCIKRLHLRTVRGYRHPDSSDAADFGNCVHKYQRCFTETGNKQLAILEAMKHFDATIGSLPSWRNKIKLMDVCANYPHDGYFTQFDPPICEKYFEVPIYQSEKFKYWVCGTMDNVAKLPSQQVVIRDFKTTASWNKNEYLADYRLSVQKHIYQAMCNIIAGLYPEEWGHLKDAAFVIDGIFLSKSKPAEYQRSEVFPPITTECMEQLLNYIIQQCKRLEGTIIPEGKFNGACSSGWFKGVKGKCSYSPICGADIDEELILTSTYEQRPYDPKEWQE